MRQCAGPCDQGRRPCPTPEACEVPNDLYDPKLAVLTDLAIAVAIIAAIAIVVGAV
jgi:hypothetical protein